MKRHGAASRSDEGGEREGGPTERLSRRHLGFGWWSLLVFLSFGLVLEALHGFKIDSYLNVANETRRLMWTLAHAHGTLLSVVNIAFGLTLAIRRSPLARGTLVSRLLVAASILLPGGFVLGGLVISAGDPGLGVLLVPIAGALLFAAVLLIARGVAARDER
jgi:hypothetical protein